MILEYNITDDDNDPNGSSSEGDTEETSSERNSGTLIIGAILSIIAMNVDRLTGLSFVRFLLSMFQGTYVRLSLDLTF